MDQSRPDQRPEQRPGRQPLTPRASRLARPVRFDPPTLVDRSRRAPSLDEHAQQLADALEAARRQGLAEGQAAVDAAVASNRAAAGRLDAAAQMLAEAARQLAAQDVDVVADLQHQAICFAVSLAEELIGRELRSCDDVVVGTIGRAMRLLPDRNNAVVRVHPDDVAVAVEALSSTVGRGALTDVVADPTIEPGGCIVAVEPLRIDAQLSGALERARIALQP